MTEDLLQKLEGKMMSLLTEVERLRQEVTSLTDENDSLRAEKDANRGKLSDLLSLLDSVDAGEDVKQAQAAANPTHRVVTASLVQG